MRVCQNPLFDKIILAIDNCDRGDSHTFWCFEHPYIFFFYTAIYHSSLPSPLFYSAKLQLAKSVKYRPAI